MIGRVMAPSPGIQQLVAAKVGAAGRGRRFDPVRDAAVLSVALHGGSPCAFDEAFAAIHTPGAHADLYAPGAQARRARSAHMPGAHAGA